MHAVKWRSLLDAKRRPARRRPQTLRRGVKAPSRWRGIKVRASCRPPTPSRPHPCGPGARRRPPTPKHPPLASVPSASRTQPFAPRITMGEAERPPAAPVGPSRGRHARRCGTHPLERRALRPNSPRIAATHAKRRQARISHKQEEEKSHPEMWQFCPAPAWKLYSTDTTKRKL